MKIDWTEDCTGIDGELVFKILKEGVMIGIFVVMLIIIPSIIASSIHLYKQSNQKDTVYVRKQLK